MVLRPPGLTKVVTNPSNLERKESCRDKHIVVPCTSVSSGTDRRCQQVQQRHLCLTEGLSSSSGTQLLVSFLPLFAEPLLFCFHHPARVGFCESEPEDRCRWYMRLRMYGRRRPDRGPPSGTCTLMGAFCSDPYRKRPLLVSLCCWCCW